MHGFSSWSHDPGPCPVDDTPHTACTPESLSVRLASTPARDALVQRLAQRRTPPPEPSPVPPFTSKTYRRATHGRRRGTRARD